MKIDKKRLERAESIVSERLRNARLKSGFSQEGLAGAAGIDRKTVNRIENGHFSPSMDTLVRLCVVMNIKVSAVTKGI